MKIPAIIATSLLLWGVVGASGPLVLGKSAASASASGEASSGSIGGSWRRGVHSEIAGGNSILGHVGGSRVAATMVASAAMETKAGLRAGKATAEEEREALHLLADSADKNAEARILADDSAVLVQGAAEAQSVAAAKTIAVEETSASLAAAAVEAEVSAAASKTSAGQALQAAQTAASALRTAASSALTSLKLARIQGAASANAAVQMEKALLATREAEAAAEKAMAAESAAAEAAAIAAAKQSEARDAGADAKAAMAALIAAQRNLVQAKARAAMSNEEASLDSKSRSDDARLNAIAQAASKASSRRDELIEIGAEFGKASGEIIATGTRSTGGKGAVVTAETKSSASASDMKKGHGMWISKGKGWSSSKADSDVSSFVIGGHKHGVHGISEASAAANAQADAAAGLLL